MAVEAINQIKTDKPLKQNGSTVVLHKTKPLPDDSVELSTKNNTAEKNNQLKNKLLGFGLIISTLSAATLIFISRQRKYISKLYNQKLVLSSLPKHIEFKEAKNLDEGIKFAKEILGIKEVDEDITLEALNIVNKGLVDVSNANKGILYIPKRIGYEETEKESTMAAVKRNICSKSFGDLIINKRYFDNKFLDQKIDRYLYNKKGEKSFSVQSKTKLTNSKFKIGCIYPQIKGAFQKLVKNYYKDKSKLNIKEKQILFHSLYNSSTEAGRSYRNPIETLQNININQADFLKKNKININFEEINKMKTKEQVEYLKKIVEQLESNGRYMDEYYDVTDPAIVICHEMGHLQDFAKNLKELDLKRYQLSLKDIWEYAKYKVKSGKNISRIGVEEINNRWGSLAQDYYKKTYNEKPELFKKLYPEFYDFLTNQEIQQTAGKVSEYSQVGIGEFIAETYANMISGKKIPDDVMALYRKYKGPELPQ